MRIRKATERDLPAMCAIYERARQFMIDTGNPRQWAKNNWPPAALLREDIRCGKSYLCTDEEDRALGTFFYDFGADIEPTYRKIEGAWRDAAPYGVVHRIASAGTQKGVGTFCIDWAFRQCGHLRIDTHGDNAVMQNLLQKLGFERRGIIYVAQDTDPRIAYEK